MIFHACINLPASSHYKGMYPYGSPILWYIQKKWVTVTFISWFSDFALYLEDYLMYKHNTLG